MYILKLSANFYSPDKPYENIYFFVMNTEHHTMKVLIKIPRLTYMAIIEIFCYFMSGEIIITQQFNDFIFQCKIYFSM